MASTGAVKALGICGSLRKGSYNRAALRAAAELLPDGMTLDVADISQLPLKNAIAWASRPPNQPFEGKPVGIMGATASLWGTTRAQYDLRKMCVYLNMFPLNKPEVLIAQAQSKFDAELKLTDKTTRDMIAQLLVALRDRTRRLRPA